MRSSTRRQSQDATFMHHTCSRWHGGDYPKRRAQGLQASGARAVSYTHLVMMVDEDTHGRLTPDKIKTILEKYK